MHQFLTVAIPFPQKCVEAVENQLNQWGNPAKKDGPFQIAFENTGVHFMSISVLEGGTEHDTFLILEGSSDEDLTLVIAKNLAREFDELFTTAAIPHQGQSRLSELLRKHAVPVGQGWLATPGLEFTGTPSMTVRRIRDEQQLSIRVREIIEQSDVSKTALQVLQAVRDQIQREEGLAFLLTSEPTPILDPVPTGGLPYARLVFRGLLTFGWPWFLAVAIVSLLSGLIVSHWYRPLIGFVTGAVFVILGTISFGVALGWLYAKLRQKEAADIPDDSPLDPASLGEVLDRENQIAQNHIGGATRMKPGWIRNFTLRFAFWFIGTTAPHRSRPGFLGELGTIHFARWVLIPRTNKLLFFSNYGGSWESYLEDFITKAHWGLTAVWSNTMGFPPTESLFFKGATHGDRFKRWARRYQWPTRFWYSAYPDLTPRRIRLNAAIRQGLASACTEDEASDWISCFGSRPRGNSMIETPEVQSIMFGGMRHLPYAACLLVRLPESEQKARVWLSSIQDCISFGDQRPENVSLIVAFTAAGLKALGSSREVDREFPLAFQEGMSKSHRSRLLGDTGEDGPGNWCWGSGDNAVHASLLVYAKDADLLTKEIGDHLRLIEELGGRQIHQVDMEVVDQHDKFSREAFGFVDGVSQPIIRGTKRWTSDNDPAHVVEPGEIILGYRDNRGSLPITPTVRATDDPANILPVSRPDCTDTELPNFSRSGGNAARDIGRNGSFLVIRQLQQDAKAFEGYLKAASESLSDHPACPVGLDGERLQHWIAAKMVGRWKDGTSLVQFPTKPGNGWCDQKEKLEATSTTGETNRARNKAPVEPDNSFLLGADDPLGFRCPFGAHVRRSNPRESFKPGSDEQLGITNRHRILRMGRNYRTHSDQEDATSEQGLLFMCLNADIERQFEFIQQTWAMSQHFHGLDREVDPILGQGGENRRLTIPTPQGPILLSGMQDFVKTRGGDYFFMPGRRAIWYLAGGLPQTAATYQTIPK